MAGRVPGIQDVNPGGTVLTRREKEDQSDPLPFRRQAFPESPTKPGAVHSDMRALSWLLVAPLSVPRPKTTVRPYRSSNG
jgi:hypothetical protein